MSTLTDKYREYLFKRKGQTVTVEDLRNFAWEIKRIEDKLATQAGQINALIAAVAALSGVGTLIIYEDLTSQVDGITGAFNTVDSFVPTKILVFYDGKLQILNTNFTVTGANQITMSGFVPSVGDNLAVAYVHI